MHFNLRMFSLGLLAVAQTGYAKPSEDTVRVIIKYKHTQPAVTALKAQINHSTQFSVNQATAMANGAYSLILKVPKSVAMANQDINDVVLQQLRKNPDVLYAVKDRVGYFKPVPDPVLLADSGNELSHANQWNEFKRPGGVLLETEPGAKDGAWEYTTGQPKKEQVVVAVLDTGIELNTSIVNNLVQDDGKVFGWNFAGNNNNLSDETKSYHGTHVAGIIAGYGEVMNGVGPDLKVLPIKVSNAEGMFYESAVVNAIYWSVGKDVPGVPDNKFPAKVLNMSFGVDEKPGKEIDYCDEALQEAVFYARKKGAVLAVAAGNDNVWEHYNAPAVCNGTLKVASTGPEGLRSYFSNYGPSITFAAPGGDKRYGMSGAILSTVNPDGGYHNSGFDFYQGTSMASPHVAGVAGLIFAASNKSLKPEKVEQILYTTTHDFGDSKDDNKSCKGKKPCGHGIVDAKNAVKTVADDFDQLFSAPQLNALKTKACGTTGMQASTEQITIDNVVWVRTATQCDTQAHFNNPHIEQLKDGSIVAQYGAASYKLDQSAFSKCAVIGFDGVGCYK